MPVSTFKFNSYFKLIAFLERLVELKFKPINKALKDAERRTMIKKVYFIHLSLVAFVIYLAMTHFYGVSRCLVTCFYPAFYTLEALESKNEQQCMQWLIFWTVFGFIKLVEPIFDALIGFMPLYSLAKLVLIIWCYVPIKNNGAQRIYQQFLLPALELAKNNSLDKAIDHLSETLKLKKKQQQQAKKFSQIEPEKALQQAAVNEAIRQLGQQNQEQVQPDGSALLAKPGSPSANAPPSVPPSSVPPSTTRQ